eukprot:2759278-Alexandrium_andersonii.AAC.1
MPPPRHGITEVRLQGAARARSALPMKQDAARRGRPRRPRPPRATEFPRKRPALSSGPGDLQGMARPPYTQ